MSRIERLRPAFRVQALVGGRATLAALCAECGHTEPSSLKSNCAPDGAAAHFRRVGWRIARDGARATCPRCQERVRRPDDDPELINKALERQRETEARRLAAQEERMGDHKEKSQTALRAAAKMHGLLASHFVADEAGERGAYEEGWSDERVATESGLAVAEVTRTRAAAYGQLEDPRLLQLERALESLRRNFAAELETFRGMVTNCEHTFGEHAQELAQQIAAARGR